MNEGGDKDEHDENEVGDNDRCRQTWLLSLLIWFSTLAPLLVSWTDIDDDYVVLVLPVLVEPRYLYNLLEPWVLNLFWNLSTVMCSPKLAWNWDSTFLLVFISSFLPLSIHCVLGLQLWYESHNWLPNISSSLHLDIDQLSFLNFDFFVAIFEFSPTCCMPF